MVRAIVVTHGDLGKALVSATESVLGPQQGCTVISNSGLSLDQIKARVSEASTSDPTLVFVDLCGGSTFMACVTLPDERRNCALVAGVNLPMLLSFFTKRDKLSLNELAETVQKDGVRGILSPHTS